MGKNQILKMRDLIPFGKPIVNSKEINLVNKVIKSGKYVHGKITEEFEKVFKKFTKSKYAITVSSCTAGMHLFYLSKGIKKGDEIILPAQTHVATGHAIELVGAKPIFIDSEPETGNIDINQIEKKITKKTKAIVVVHFLGIPVDMTKIKKIAKKNNLLILEDCALALGSKVNGKHVGLFGDAGVFSFYPVKHITTAEGGMVITNDKKLFDTIKSKKAFGVDKNYNQRNYPGMYDVKELGLNYRMSEIHASLGVEQMKKITKFLKIRERNFNFLKNSLKIFSHFKILSNSNKKLTSSNYCMSLVLNNKVKRFRTKIINLINSSGIGTSIYYPKPVPMMKYYKKKYNFKNKYFFNAQTISQNSISIPVGPQISFKKIKYMKKKIENIFLKINA